MSIKYSVVLPVLNGAETLHQTFPEMLRTIDRDDVEFVVSSNLSDDATKDIVLACNDPRVSYFEPPRRLCLGEHLNFAYLQAVGEWQGHIGHDDHLFPSRFDYADKVIDEYSPQLIRGKTLSYIWPNYPHKELSNAFCPCSFDKAVSVWDGMTLAKQLINTAVIPGGGQWVVRKRILEAIRKKVGCRSATGVEFFLFRAGALLSEKVVLSNYPFFMQGSHISSGGTQIFTDKALLNDRITWNRSLECPKWQYCPFNSHGFLSVSMDSAMQVCDIFQEELGGKNIDEWFWLKYAKSDFQTAINLGQIPAENIKFFYEGRKSFPIHLQVMSVFRELAKDFYRKFIKKKPVTVVDETLDNVYQTENCFGWPHHLKAELFGLKSMKGAPAAIEKYFEDSFHFKEL